MTVTSNEYDLDAPIAAGAFHACAQFEADHLDADGPCVWCGWLHVDHLAAQGIDQRIGATVVALPPRLARPLTIRRAS